MEREMAKPIRERGIRWVETYGDKSTYLKEGMREQIGPGSYFRWEGHDSTTGNDYYVVVSPGFSKTKGYFFFAGLRKMPADHGASGKKFGTQAEAMTHAFETWGVPRPQEKPAKPYTKMDIMGKEIIHEIQHKAESDHKMVIISSIQHEAMASGPMMKACGLGSKWQRLTTQKHLPSAICGAIKQSGTMGFLAGMYNQLSLVGVDGFNHPVASELPYSPIVATCQAADAKGVTAVTEPDWRVKLLYELPRGGKKYLFSQPRRTSEDDQYKHLRWKDVKVGITSSVPYRLYGRIGGLVNQLKAMEKDFPDRKDPIDILLPHKFNQEEPIDTQINAYLRGQDMARSRGKKAADANSSLRMTVNVIPELYLKAKNLISQYILDQTSKTGISPIPSKPTISLALIIEQLAEEKNMKEGMPFDPEQVIAEKSMISGSQFFLYDDHGMPFMLSGDDKSLSLVPRSNEDEVFNSDTVGGQIRNSLNGSKRLISDHISAGINGLGMKYMELKAKQEEFVTAKKANINTPDNPALRSMAASIAMDTKALMAMAKAVKLQPGGRDQSVQRFLADCDKYINLRVAAATEASANKPADTVKMNEALNAVKPYFEGFRALADLGLVDVKPERYVYGQTCAPVQSQIYTKGYDTDAAGLPKNPRSLTTAPVPKAIVPETPVSAIKHGNTFVARQHVKQGDAWGETLAEVDPNKVHQTINGAHLYVTNAEQSALYHGEEDGSPSFVTRKAMPRLDPNSSGRYISKGAMAILARPVGHSPQKTGAGKDFGGGWEILEENFWATESGGIPAGSKQWSPDKLSLPNPDKGNDFYQVMKDDGESMNVADTMYKDQDGVKWKDFGAMASFMQNKFCLSDDVMGCITQTTRSDLFTSRDYEETSKYVFNTVSKYNESIRNPVFRKTIELGKLLASGNPPPAGINSEQAKAASEAFMLSQEAKSLMSDPEYHSLYSFGSICKYCDVVDKGGMGDTVSPRVVAMLEEAMNNPRASLRPKAGRLYGIKMLATGPEGKKEEQWIKNPGDADPMLFSSSVSPWIRQYLQHYKTTMPDSNPRIEIYADNDVLVQSVKRSGNLVQGRENLERMLYASKGQQPPSEPWEDDVSYALKAEETGEEEEVPGTQPQPEEETDQIKEDEVQEEEAVTEKPPEPTEPVVPEAPVPTPEEIKPEHVPGQPAPQATQPYSSSQMSGALRMMLRPVMNQLKGIDLRNLGAAPPQVVMKAKQSLERAMDLISMNPNMRPEETSSTLREMGLDALADYTPPLSPHASATVEKLIKLANKLDEEGKLDEAGMVDKVIKATIEKDERSRCQS
jgi:hypothetical protein